MHKHKHKHLARPSFCIFKEGTRKEVGISFNGFCFYTAMPSFGRMCTKVKACNQILSFFFFFLSPEYIRACEALDNIGFNYQFKIFTFSNIRRLNNKPLYRTLRLLSGDISLNPGLRNNLQSLDSNEWNICKLKGLHLIHLNINGLLPKLDKLQYIANSNNATVIGIPKYRLDKFFLPSEVQINNYDQLRWDKKRNGGGVTCYVRSDISYIQTSKSNTFLKKLKVFSLKFFYLKPSQ